MTTFEHALVGVNGLLATGLQKHYGWKLVAIAAVAAVAPDWDGIPMLIDMGRFESGHRVWGHNVLSCFLLAVVLGVTDYYCDLVGGIASRLTRWGPLKELADHVVMRKEIKRREGIIWVGVCFVAALSQIPADAVVSGAEGLSDWALKPFWPFSNYLFIYPMVPWGNVGVTLIFAIALIVQVKRPSSARLSAIAALTSVVIYIWFWGTFVRT